MERGMALAAILACLTGFSVAAEPNAGAYQVENLGRGVVALRTGDASVYVGWRLLGTDPAGLAAIGRMGGLGYATTRQRFEIPMGEAALRAQLPEWF